MDRRAGWELLGVTTAAFFATMVARLVTSPLVPRIIDDFAVSKSEVGVAFTGLWAAYAVFQFPGGVLVDRVGEKRVIVLAMAATGLASLVLSLSPSFPLFALFSAGVGACAGLYLTAGTAFLSKQFERTGRVLGIHEVGASAGGLVAPVAAAAVAVRFGWRAGPLVPAALAGVVAVLFAWRAPATPPGAPGRSLREGLDVARLGRLLARPGVAFTTVVAMGGYFTWQAFASFFPTFLVEYGGLGTGRASLVFGVVFALTVVGAPALGRLSDAVGRDAVLAGSFLAAIGGYAAFLSGGGLPVVAGATALMGVGLSFPGVVNSRFIDNLAPAERGSGFGLVRSIVLLVSSLGSVVTGTLADGVGWAAAYGTVAGLLGLLVVLLAANRVLGVDA